MRFLFVINLYHSKTCWLGTTITKKPPYPTLWFTTLSVERKKKGYSCGASYFKALAYFLIFFFHQMKQTADASYFLSMKERCHHFWIYFFKPLCCSRHFLSIVVRFASCSSPHGFPVSSQRPTFCLRGDAAGCPPSAHGLLKHIFLNKMFHVSHILQHCDLLAKPILNNVFNSVWN